MRQFQFQLLPELEFPCKVEIELELDFEFKFAKLNLRNVVRNSQRCPIPKPKWDAKWPSGGPEWDTSGTNSHRCPIPESSEVKQAPNSLRPCAVVQILETLNQMLPLLHELLPHTP